ncbi:MAG TPA: nuclear transport factor 2 family protein, partial [Tahibacter sp.]|nr:nuclear transport factor 2 family protein [Tahibacter sp.]
FAAHAQSPGPAEAELIGLQNAWAAARIDGDTAFLEKLYAKEFRIVNAGGGVVGRDADIALFATRTIRPEYIRDEDMRVSRYGDTALVTGVEKLKGTYNGVPGEMALRFTNVYVRRDARWQMVSHHSTRIREKTDEP